MTSVSDILERLLGEWGASPAFEIDQIAKAEAELKALMESCVPERMPGQNTPVRQGYNQAREETLANIRKAFE